MSQFSKKEAIKFGWQKMQQNFKFLLLVMILMMVVQGVQSYVNQFSRGDEGLTALAAGVISVIFGIINIVLAIGIIKIALKIVDDSKPSFANFLNNWQIMVKYFVTQIMYSFLVINIWVLLLLVALFSLILVRNEMINNNILIVCTLIILGFILGIYWGIKYQFAQYFIIAENQGVITAFKNSATITKGEISNLFLFGILMILINIAGALVFLIGLFATIPTTMIATAYVFRKLQGKGVPSPIPLPETKPAL